MSPSPCKSDCSFCTQQKEYGKVDEDKILENIGRFGANAELRNLVKDVVFSGGEPLYSPNFIREAIETYNLIIKNHDVNYFINTMLPKSAVSLFNTNGYFVKKSRLYPKINGISVSRQLTYEQDKEMYKSPATDEDIKDIATRIPVRVNTYWNKEIELLVIIQLLADRWVGSRVTVVNIREDFNCSEDTPLIKRRSVHQILAYQNIEWVSRVSCRVCETIYVKYTCKKGVMLFGIHKGEATTSQPLLDDDKEVNDFIVYPDGLVCYDWGREYTVELKKSSTLDSRPQKKEEEEYVGEPSYNYRKYSCGTQLPSYGSCGRRMGRC